MMDKLHSLFEEDSLENIRDVLEGLRDVMHVIRDNVREKNHDTAIDCLIHILKALKKEQLDEKSH